MSKRLDEVMQLVSGVGKQKEEVRTEAASSSGVKSERLKEVQKYTALLPLRYQEAQDAGKRSALQSQFRNGLQQSQAAAKPEAPMSPTAFVNQRLGQTEQQQREQRLQTAWETGELSRQMQEDPTQYQRTMAQRTAMEAATKLQEARQKVETVQAKEQELMHRQTGLESSYTALQGLLEQYQRTGNDVDGKAYLLAAQQYEEMRSQFNTDLAQYQKDAAAYDQYNSAWERAQKAQASYEKAKADYLDAHPAEKYQDASLEEIYQVMQDLRSEIDEDYEKAYANGTYKKWEDLNALYKQKALEDNGLWNSGAADFADRVLTATEAGQMDWLAGVANLDRKAGNALLRIASTTLGNVADMIGSESLKEKSKELLKKSKSTSPDAEAAQEASRSLMLDALTGTGEIDGWIIQQMESVGAMWMDAFAAGTTGAMGLMGGATSLQIMGTRAAGSAMLDAQEKGYSEMEQLMVGAAVGGLEVVSEKLFGGNPLYDSDKGLVNQLVEKVTQNTTILRLMYSRGFDIMGEGLEEVFTEILDPVAEAMMTGSADVDWASAEEIEQAFLGGVFLGLMGQGVDAAVDAAANSGTRKAYRELGAQMVQADAVREVVAEGLEADPRSAAYQNAVKLQKKLDAGREVTVREVGQQLMANQEAIEAGLLVDQEVEPVQDAPEGSLQDPEEGFYAIQIEQGTNGKAEFRLVEVAPDGSISYKSNTMVSNLFDAKIAAEIEGLNIRQIGTSASLRAAVEAKGEENITSEAEEGAQGPSRLGKQETIDAVREKWASFVEQNGGLPTMDTYHSFVSTLSKEELDALNSWSKNGQTQSVEEEVWAERIAAAPAEPRNDSAEMEMPTETEGIQWAGNMPETLNGGTEYGTEQQEAEQKTVGDGGNQERNRGNAAGQAARSPRQQFARDALRRAEEARRVQSHVQAVGGELVSLREQGLSNGSTDRTVWTVPKEAWTTEIQDAAEIAESEGLEFIPLSGAMYINYGKGEARINGAVEDGKVFVQTDSTKMDAREITMHEVFHEKAAKDQTLVPRLVQLIQEKYTKEQTEEMLQRYYDAYQEIYSGRASDEALEEMIWEEMLADAYAEFQRFLDADASQFGMDVQEAVWNKGETTDKNVRFSLEGHEEDLPDLIAQGTEHAATIEPVREMDGTEFAKGETNLEEQVAEYFSSIGNRVEHPILGEVLLNRRGAKDDISHGIGRNKAITFMAVPDVIEKGGMIDYKENWKGRGYDTAVIAAPVTIAGNQYMMGVVLKRTNRGNSFYVHEVMAESEEGATPFKTGAVKNGLTGGDTPSIRSLLQKVMKVKQGNVRYSLESQEDNRGRTLTAEQLDYFKDSQARDTQGRLLTLFHQTENEFTVFETRRQGAGSSDDGTPFGIFMKTGSEDIGLRGKRQMELYANITNPLRAYDRSDLTQKLKNISPVYSDLLEKHNELDREYKGKVEAAGKAIEEYMMKWRKENPEASRTALYDVPEFMALHDAEDAVIEEWEQKGNELSVEAKDVLTQALRDAGYDGVFLTRDAGSFGRSTNAYIALDPEQVKNVTNKAPTSNPDIRYSMDSEGNPLSEEQEKFFEGSKVRVDEYGEYWYGEGNLLPVYHSTYSDFNVFYKKHLGENTDGNAADEGLAATAYLGFWFNTQDLTKNRRSGYEGGRAIKAYLNIKKPYEAGTLDGLVNDILDHTTSKSPKTMARDFLRKLKWDGYDGIVLEDREFGGISFVAFESNQIKNVDNQNPTKSKDIRYSVDTKKTKEDKARERAEREMAKGLGEIMSMPQSAVRELQEGIVRQIMEEYQQTGEIDQEKLDTALSEAFAKGLMVDDEFYQQYKPVKDYLRSQALTISEQDRADIADFTDFRKRAFGTLRIVNNGGLPVDTAYQELQGMAPELFPMDITQPADQLVRMYEVCQEIKKVQVPLERALGENADEFFDFSQKKMNDLVERTLEKYAKSVDWKPAEKKQQKPEKRQTISQEARERFEQAEREEAPVLQWAGQEEMEGFAPQEQQTETTKEAPQTLEQAANGTMQEWIQFVLSGKMTPEEFAEMNRNAKSRELTGRAKEEAENILSGHSLLNSVKRDEMTDEEVAALIRQFEANQENAADRNAQTVTPVDELIIRKADFTGTPAMEKLGIRIDGSVTRYRQTRQLKEYEEAAYGASKMLNKRIRQLKATEQEKELARLIVEGTITADALDNNYVNVEVIAELADYFMAANSFKLDMIAQRRAEINTMNYRLAQDLFRDAEAYTPQLPGVLKGMTKLVMNERTPERVVKQIFGQEQGGKIYETYFRPVWVNGAEMSRFESRMLDRVREFQDKDGKKRALTAQEREFTQRLMEGQAARDAVESLADASKEKVTAVAQNLNNGAAFADQIREWGMVGDEYLQGVAQAYADYLDTVAMSKDMDQTILQNAIETYRQIYNELYEAVNDFLTSHGYKPIGFIKGYAPHFQKREVQQGLFGALKSLGVEKESVSELPASIAGRTADFKPNMKWNPHFQSRKGEKTSYDIEAGYEQYIHYVAEMFYHTDDVMRIRQAVNYFRQAYSSEDISQAIEDAKVDQFKDVAWKKDFLEQKELLRPGVNLDDRAVNAAYEQYVSGLFDQAKPENLRKYSEFVTWMDNYANIVAGKQSMADRGIEYGGGRNALNMGSKLMRRFASANVAGNLSSVLNQTAQVPLIQQQLGKYMERAMWDMARGTTAKENFAERSDFLTDKRGVEKLTTDNAEKFISMLFKPAEMMDRMVSTLAVRGRYLQALDQGMTMEQAMKEADDFGRRVMGSRMKGAKPLAYESKTFVNQMIHIFQVEASNTFDYMALSDMPQAIQQVYKNKGKAAGARYLASYIVGYLMNAFLLNQMTDTLYGGTPAPFDLMGWALNFVAGGWGLTDEEFLKTVTDNGLERIVGERPFGTEPIDSDSGFRWAGSLSDLGYNVSNDLPYVRNVAGVLGLGDQSLPTVGLNELGESLGDAGSALWNQTFKGQEETGLTWAGTMQKVGEDLLSAVAQLIPGGRQLKKTAQGVKTMVQGGATSGYGDNQRLKYPVEQNVWNWARGILFGNAAMDEYDAYYVSGNQPLTAGQTQKVKELEDLGIDRNISYELYQEFREINSNMTGVEASTAKRNAINALDLTDDQKLEVFDRFFLDHTADSYEETRAEYQAMLDAGLTWNDVTLAHNEYADLQADEVMRAIEKATALAKWADQQGWNEAQIEAVKERYKFYSMTPAEATNYEKFTGAGLQGDNSAKLTEILAGLTPEDGRETVSTNQKILAIQGSDLTDDEKAQAIVAMVPERRERLVEAGVSDETAKKLAAAFAVEEAENGDEELSFLEKARIAVDMAKSNDEAMAALSTILQESTYGKLETAAAYGVTARAWVDYREAWTEAYGSDSVSQEKVEKILDRMNLNDRQKAALWQIANKSWKPANNPYSVSVGEDIFDMLNEE